MTHTKKILSFIALVSVSVPIALLGYTKFATWTYAESDFGRFTEALDSAFNCDLNCGWTRINSETIGFTGEIKRGALNQSTQKLDSLITSKTKLIVLNSQGGDVESAIKLAEAIIKHNLDTEVNGICLSGCANYLFPAGKNKKINGVLGFHGGMASILAHEEKIIQSKDRSAIPVTPETYKKMVALENKERLLSTKTGLKRELLLMSGQPDKGEGDGIIRGIFFPTMEEIEFYGIKNVSGNQSNEIICGYQKRKKMFFLESQYRFVYHGKFDCSIYDWF